MQWADVTNPCYATDTNLEMNYLRVLFLYPSGTTSFVPLACVGITNRKENYFFVLSYIHKKLFLQSSLNWITWICRPLYIFKLRSRWHYWSGMMMFASVLNVESPIWLVGCWGIWAVISYHWYTSPNSTIGSENLSPWLDLCKNVSNWTNSCQKHRLQVIFVWLAAEVPHIP